MSLEKRILSPRLPAVTRLAVGSLTIGPLQADLSPEAAGEVLAYAFDRGINFLDTAQYYRNYPHIREGLRRARCGDDVIVSSKTYAWDRAGALAAVDEARSALDRDVIDIFMLHEQESIHTLRGHREALDTLFALREKGVIRAVGISTHCVAAVEGALTLCEEGTPLDVLHPLYNMAGIGIADGGEADMARALARLHDTGCGIFGMKALGGGHLFRRAKEAFSFVLHQPFIDAVAVGMQSALEVDANIALFSEETLTCETEERQSEQQLCGLQLAEKLRELQREKRLRVDEYCEGCGACVRRCPAGAMSLAAVGGETENPYDFSDAFATENGLSAENAPSTYRAVCDAEKCVLCGYCTGVCPVFALKVY